MLNLFLRSFQKSKSMKCYKIQLRNVSSDFVLSQNGLLSGISDIKKAQFYSDNILIKSSYELLQNPNHIYSICLKNAGGNITKLNENLKNMSDKAKNFVESNEVWDRQELITSIESVIEDKGKFVCLLAGKNTGKSLVLRHMEKKLSEKVYKVDLRLYPDILGCLLWTLHDRQQICIKDKIIPLLTDTFSRAIGQFFGDYKMFTEKEFEEKLNVALGKRNPGGLKSVIANLVADLGVITLVIDEANIALKITDRTSADDVKATSEALALFTLLTKQEKKVTTSKS